MKSVAGDALRAARARGGLTQRQLAAAAAVPASTVGRIESGARQPTVPMLLHLLTCAGASPRIHLQPNVSTRLSVPPAAARFARPVQVPVDLGALRGPTSGRAHLPGSVYSSGAGPGRAFDLDDDGERVEFYELVLAGATATEMESLLEVNELVRLWPRLWLAPHVQHAWAAVIPFPCANTRP